MPEKLKACTPVMFMMIWGKAVTRPRKSAPQRVMRLITCSRNLTVGSPGRTPGMKPPYSRRLSAILLGSNCTAV